MFAWQMGTEDSVTTPLCHFPNSPLTPRSAPPRWVLSLGLENDFLFYILLSAPFSKTWNDLSLRSCSEIRDGLHSMSLRNAAGNDIRFSGLKIEFLEYLVSSYLPAAYWKKFCITEEWDLNNFLPLKKLSQKGLFVGLFCAPLSTDTLSFHSCFLTS